MNKEKSLVKNTFIIGFGKICTSLITFLLLPLYTGVLSTEEYGIVDLLTTLISLMIPILTLKIEDAVFRKLIDSRDDQEKTKSIISTGFASIIFQIIGFTIIFLIVQSFVKNDYKFFLLSNLIIYVFLSFLQQISRGLGKITEYSVGSFLSALSTIIFNILFLVVIPLHAYGMLLGTFLGHFVSCVYFVFRIKIYNYINLKKTSKGVLKSLLKYSVPLIPNALSWWVFSASDRVIVSSFLGVDQNGILAASLKFSTIITTLYSIFDASWIESVSYNIDAEDIEEYFNRMFNAIFKMFSTICLLAIVFMPFVFPILINSKFSAGYNLIPITIVSALFNVTQGLVAVVYAAKLNTKSLAKTSLIGAVLNIIVHLSLIKYLGLYAAVISTLVALMALSIYRLIEINQKYLKIKIDLKYLTIYGLIMIGAFIIYYTKNVYLNITACVFGVICFLLFNRKSFKLITNLILKKMNIKIVNK